MNEFLSKFISVYDLRGRSRLKSKHCTSDYCYGMISLNYMQQVSSCALLMDCARSIDEGHLGHFLSLHVATQDDCIISLFEYLHSVGSAQVLLGIVQEDKFYAFIEILENRAGFLLASEVSWRKSWSIMSRDKIWHDITGLAFFYTDSACVEPTSKQMFIENAKRAGKHHDLYSREYYKVEAEAKALFEEMFKEDEIREKGFLASIKL